MVAPSPVHPQPEMWIATHIHLQHVGAALRELANRIRPFRLRSRHGAVEDQAITATGKRKCKDRNHGCAGSQRKRRKCRRRRRRAVEELDRYGIRIKMLIDQHRHAAVALQVAQHPSEAALTIDDCVAGARPDSLEHRVQMRIVERPRHDRDRLGMQGEYDRLNLPVAKVTGEIQHALALPIRLPYVLLPLDLHALQPALRRQTQRLQNVAAGVAILVIVILSVLGRRTPSAESTNAAASASAAGDRIS